MSNQGNLLLTVVVLVVLAGASDLGAQDFHDAYFIGHLSPDSDTFAATIAAAHLFGGTAVRPGSPNRESAFLLAYFDVAVPDSLAVADGKRFVLVDHNQRTQVHPGIQNEQIIGIIDHHALREAGVVTAGPIYVDIRPWGSTSTIVAKRFFAERRTLPRPVAGVLLGGLLSDTQLLTSPTSAAADSALVDTLALLAGIEDWHAFGLSMLEAKSRVSELSPREIVLSDFKSYEIAGRSVGFGVAQTVRPGELLRREGELRAAMAEVKAARRFDLMFFAVVDPLEQLARMILLGSEERRIAEAAYGGTIEGQVMVLRGFVSRKLQFIPPLERVVGREER